MVFLVGNKFCDFQKVPDKELIIFSFSLSTCNEIINNYIFSNNTNTSTTAWVPLYVKPNERQRQVVVEQTQQFLSTVFFL